MPFAYILSTYEEHGADDVIVTLERDKLPALLAHYEPNPHEIQNLADVLALADEEIVAAKPKRNLSRGWGGIQLHVVRLC